MPRISVCRFIDIRFVLQSFLMRPRKFTKIKDVFINFSYKKGPHITKFKDARANGGPKIKLKGALSNNKKKERDNAGCKNFMEYGQNSSKNSEGLDKNNKRIGGMF